MNSLFTQVWWTCCMCVEDKQTVACLSKGIKLHLSFTVHNCMYVDTYMIGYWKTNWNTTLGLCTYSILLPQLLATFKHYACTVALPGLANWSTFVEEFLRPCKVTTDTMGPMGAIDGRYGSEIGHSDSETSLWPSILFGPTVGFSWTHI